MVTAACGLLAAFFQPTDAGLLSQLTFVQWRGIKQARVLAPGAARVALPICASFYEKYHGNLCQRRSGQAKWRCAGVRGVGLLPLVGHGGDENMAGTVQKTGRLRQALCCPNQVISPTPSVSICSSPLTGMVCGKGIVAGVTLFFAHACSCAKGIA